MKKHEWASVDFALPDTTRWVWIMVKKPNGKSLVGIGYFDNAHWYFIDNTPVISIITHWMTLTAPKKPITEI